MAMLTEKIKELISVEAAKYTSKYEKGDRHAHLISVCSQKGGVGKTTTAVNLGAALSRFHGCRVLVVDLDPQGHVEKSLGSIIPDGVEYTPLSSVLMNKKGNLLDTVIKTEVAGLHITPGDKVLYETDTALASRIGRELILDHALALAKTIYDFILFDCPPNLGNLTINALCASDYALIPCEMSVLAFEGVTDLLDTIATVNERLNRRLEVLGVLFTRVDGRNVTMNEVIEQNIRSFFKGSVLKSRIAINTALNKAQLEGVPIFDFEGSSSGAENYASLAQEVVRKLQAQQKAAHSV